MQLQKAWRKFFICALLIIALLSAVLMIVFYNISTRQETVRMERVSEFVRAQRLELIENIVNNFVTAINTEVLATQKRAARDLESVVVALGLIDADKLGAQAEEIIVIVSEISEDIDIFVYSLQDGYIFGKPGSEINSPIGSRRQFERYFEDYAAYKIISLGDSYLIGCGISKTTAYNTLLDSMQTYADSQIPLGDVYIRVDAMNNYNGQGDFARRIIIPFFQKRDETVINAENADYFGKLKEIVENGSATVEYTGNDNLEFFIYAKLYRPYDWLVSCSVSANDIKQLAKTLEEDFQKRQNNSMLIIAVMCLLFTAAAIIFFILLGRLFFNTADNEVKLVEAANQAKSNFLSAMSHEIRTPMNAIIGIAQIQLQSGNVPHEHKAALERIYSSGSNLLGIINDILDLSKIETGKLELNNAEYDVPSLINDAANINVVRIASKPVDLILDIDANLPLRLFGDELRLKQILNNLLSNAIKYTDKGSVTLSVSADRRENDVMLNFSVKDTGQGIKPEDMERLFSEYLRFNTEANRSTEGTGIGLNITKNLVSMMDGLIEVESEYGKGSIFKVMVKQQAVCEEVIGPELAENLRIFNLSAESKFSQFQINSVPMPYGKVLIVDDVETNLYVAQGLLTPYQLKIETVKSGFAAIEKANSTEVYDIIFMDHMMPLMDGIETTKRLRENGYDGVIIALTANALAGNDEMFKKSGFDGFIAKPIDIRQLDEALNKFIRERHPEEAAKQEPTQEEQTPARPVGTDTKLLQIFRRDAQNAAKVLRETAESDIKLFTITAHAMKSALLSIGENEQSKQALALEEAGLKSDMAYIAENTERFINALEALVKNIDAPEEAPDAGADRENTAYLIEQLRITELACEDHNREAAIAALDRLKEKQYIPEIAAALDEMRDILLTEDDFDAAIELIWFISDSLS